MDAWKISCLQWDKIRPEITQHLRTYKRIFFPSYPSNLLNFCLKISNSVSKYARWFLFLELYGKTFLYSSEIIHSRLKLDFFITLQAFFNFLNGYLAQFFLNFKFGLKICRMIFFFSGLLKVNFYVWNYKPKFPKPSMLNKG